MSTSSTTLAELCISIAAKAWQKDGEILATGIGLIPRLAVGLSKLHFNKDLLMTDGEAFLIDQPISLGQKIPISSAEGLMTYSRVFDLLWSGHRHAMVSPTQIDKYAQMNISCIGEYQNPKVQLLGVRGFPGNSICHKNSVFIPNHTKKVFVDVSIGAWRYGEVDWPKLLFWMDWFSPAEIILEKDQISKFSPKLGAAFADRVSILNRGEEESPELPHFCKENSFLASIYEHLFFFQPKIDRRMQSLAELKDELRMEIDPMVLSHLEIFVTRSGRRGHGTLFHAINYCRTAGGSRVLIANLKAPLIGLKEIENRQNMVYELLQKRDLRSQLREILSLKFDFERICQKLSVFKVNPRNLLQLLDAIQRIPKLKSLGNDFSDEGLKQNAQRLLGNSDLEKLLERSISEECLGIFKEGVTIRRGFDSKLDELRNFKSQSSEILLNLEQRYREETGIQNLKIKYNRVFGYLVEVSRAQVSKLPDHFDRRQTLTNYERFSTSELKEVEEKILSAQEQSEVRERELFEKVLVLPSNINLSKKDLLYFKKNIDFFLNKK